jgi:transposase
VTRVAVALSCSAEQRTELMSLARSRTEQARLVERAKIILACLDGKRNDEVSRELGVRPNTVGVWRKRFAARGLAGLRDQPRPGKKPRYGEELRRRVLRQLELPPPPGLAGWDGGTLAAALGVSDAAVWRVLRKDGIQLRRHRSWCVSTDPQFAAKAAVPKPAGEGAGAQRRRKAVDPGLGTGDRLCSDQQREDRPGSQEHL